MPTLGFLNVGGEKYSLKYGESYVIGLKSDEYAHDIEINDKSVDIKHCILDFTEPIPKIFDIKSKCGTFVDHERIPSCSMLPLKKTTNIQIGSVDATLQLSGESDSGFLEDKLSPPVKDNGPERDVPNPVESRAASSAVDAEHHFLVPTTTARTLARSIGNSTGNESCDSFTIPETQMPAKDAMLQADDDEDSFYIPETQDVGAPNMLCNYPRVAFEAEDVNETVADCDKIPSSQFRICTQDFNGSNDDLSNHSDDILANVPCSLVIPTIRHSPVQINDVSRRTESSGIEKELSAVQWSRTSHQTTQNAPTPDGVGNLDVPNQQAIGVPVQSSQCSTPDIFADHDPLLDEMEKSLKENDPPPTLPVGHVKQSQVIQRPLAKKASSTPNCKMKANEVGVEKSPLPPTQVFLQQGVDKSPLPPTQVFFQPPPKTKHPPVIENPNPITLDDDDDLPPTQVFQPVPTKPKSVVNNIMSSTLVDSGTQLSECSFKAKWNKYLDSDDDEMDEVVAPELVQKNRECLENANALKKTHSITLANNSTTPPQEHVNVSTGREKMLPPKNVPIQTPKEKPTANAQKQKSNNCDAKYVNIDDFLCTPDFLGKEFAKDENLQKKAEQNWKNQRKTLFKHEETPTKPVRNESDDSQDSFIDLIPHKKKQEESGGERSESKAQKEITPKKQGKSKESPTEVVAARVTRRRPSSMKKETASEPKVDVKIVKKQARPKRSASTSNGKPEAVVDKKDDSSSVKKSKDSRAGGISASITSQNSVNNLEDSADAKLANEIVEKQISRRITRRKSTISTDVKSRKPSARLEHPTSNKGESEKLNDSKVSLENCQSSVPCQGKASADQKYSERRILEVVLSKNGAEQNSTNSSKPSLKSSTGVLSRTRSQARSSEDSLPAKAVNTSAEERAVVIQKLSDKKSSTTREEKNASSIEEDKSNAKTSTGQIQVVKREEKVKKPNARNKIEEDEEKEKPQKRVTRLRSGKPAEVSPATEQPSRVPTQVKSSRQTRGRTKTPKELEKDEPVKQDRADSKEPHKEDRSNSRTRSSGVKRKSKEEEVEPKRSRSSSSEGIQARNRGTKSKLKIAMTMCDPRYQEVLEKYSGNLWVYTKDPKECDVIILEKGNRTYKLMVAIARGIPVLKLEWLQEVLKRKSIDVPTEEYIFQDRQFQERHQFVMKKSLFLAKSTSLFKDISFMMTPNIRPSPDEMKDIITCAGGTVLEQIPKGKQRIFLVSHSKDNQYWHQYRRSNSNVKIVTTEGVMASVMQQSEGPLTKSIIQ